MTDVELAWLAGLLEGEGAFILQHVAATEKQAARLRVKIALHMTDHDVVQRVSDTVGLGRLIMRPRQQAHHKDTFFWQISGMAETVELMRQLRPLLGERRRAQIDRCLSEVEAMGGVRDRRRREHADVV